jgi:transcriptional regulator with XRE-family HTH domain
VILTAELIRASRALLGWTQKDLSLKTGITPKALSDFELGKKPLSAKTNARMKAAFEANGIQYLAVNDNDSELDGIGLRWRAASSNMEIKII